MLMQSYAWSLEFTLKKVTQRSALQTTHQQTTFTLPTMGQSRGTRHLKGANRSRERYHRDSAMEPLCRVWGLQFEMISTIAMKSVQDACACCQ